MKLSPRPITRILLAMLACGPAALTGGCTLLGVIAHKASPPPKVPARHTLAGEPTIVLVERSANPGEAAMDAQKIAQEITHLMRDNGVKSLLDPALAFEIRSRRNADGTRLRPSEVARAAGATQFIYVDLTNYQTTHALGGEASDGQAQAAVWVVDARSAEAVWPPESNQGYPVAVAAPFSPVDGGTTAQTVRQKLNTDLSLNIARLFYTWIAE